MQIGDFDTASMRHHQLFRDARTAMLVHRVFHQMERTAASVDEVEGALEELAEATRRPTADFIGPEWGDTLRL